LLYNIVLVLPYIKSFLNKKGEPKARANGHSTTALLCTMTSSFSTTRKEEKETRDRQIRKKDTNSSYFASKIPSYTEIHGDLEVIKVHNSAW